MKEEAGEEEEEEMRRGGRLRPFVFFFVFFFLKLSDANQGLARSCPSPPRKNTKKKDKGPNLHSTPGRRDEEKESMKWTTFDTD